MHLSQVIDYLANLTGLSRDWTGFGAGLLIGLIIARILRSLPPVTIDVTARAGAAQKTGLFSPDPVSASTSTITFDGPESEQLMELIRAGQMIEAIKLIRAKHGLELVDAKRIVDGMKASLKK